MNKKSQAAMEFLMTYGWAILVVLAAIGALAYFGVLKPQQFMPEQCVLAPGMACLDFKITSNQTTILISNSLGRDIDVINITAGNCSEAFNQTLENGEKSEFILTGCDNGEEGAKFKEDIIFEYINKASGFSKTIRGLISAKVQ